MQDPNEIPFRGKHEYITQWKRNRRCAQGVDREFRDWQVTMVFYAALHAINAAAAHLGEKPCDHESRNHLVRKNEAFAGIRKSYLFLYRLSRWTRYDPEPDSWMPQECLDAQTLVERFLKPIENQVEVLLQMKLSLPPIKLQG